MCAVHHGHFDPDVSGKWQGWNRSDREPRSFISPAQVRQPRYRSTKRLQAPQDSKLYHLEVTMWNKPEYTEMRFGFEVTMYIANR